VLRVFEVVADDPGLQEVVENALLKLDVDPKRSRLPWRR
jgi:hypothetical protein